MGKTDGAFALADFPSGRQGLGTREVSAYAVRRLQEDERLVEILAGAERLVNRQRRAGRNDDAASRLERAAGPGVVAAERDVSVDQGDCDGSAATGPAGAAE